MPKPSANNLKKESTEVLHDLFIISNWFELFSLFMWVWRFAVCHKKAVECGCFLGLQRVPASVSVWDTRFSPHAVHVSMQKQSGCGCESMFE
jgi:hypothetical protein